MARGGGRGREALERRSVGGLNEANSEKSARERNGAGGSRAADGKPRKGDRSSG